MSSERSAMNCAIHAFNDCQRQGAFPQVAKPDFAELPVVPMPVDVTDAARFPEIAAAGKYLASLSPERRAELERERP